MDGADHRFEFHLISVFTAVAKWWPVGYVLSGFYQDNRHKQELDVDLG